MTISGYDSSITNAAKVVIPETVKYNNTTYTVSRIDDNAFENNTVITDLVIPSSVQTISSYAFIGSSLTNVTLNVVDSDYELASLQPWGETLPPISNITVADGTSWIAVLDSLANDFFGFTYTPGSDGECTLIKYSGLATELSIPERVKFPNDEIRTVTVINNGVFASNNNITSVTIPSSVTTINDAAFEGCGSLGTVTFEEGSQLKTIKYHAFYCASLTSLIIPSGVTEIGAEAFAGAKFTSITIPSSVTTIYFNAFGTNMTNVTLNVLTPNFGLTSMQPWGDVLPPISNITYADGASWYSKLTVNADGKETDMYGFTYEKIDDDTDDKCTLTGYTGTATELVIPKEVIFSGSEETTPRTVTAIGNSAFSKNVNITSVTIPSSVETIMQGAFFNCPALGTVTFEEGSKLKSIGSDAFKETPITSIAIPSSVTTIGDNSFSGNRELASVTIPSSVTTIGNSAFSGCTSLKEINFEELSKLESIGESAFRNTNLTSLTIPSSVTSIGDHAFSSNDSLETVNLKELSALKSIGSNAFNPTKLTLVTIPSSVTTIGVSAFPPTALKNATLHILTANFGLTSMQPWGVGDSCPTLTGITYADESFKPWYPKLELTSGKETDMYGFTYEKIDDDTDDKCTLTGYTGSAKELVIPEKVIFSGDEETTPRTVTAIASAFQDNEIITKVTLPDTITSIGDSAFNHCTELVTVNIPERVKTIGNSSFFTCSKLSSVTLPDTLKSLGNNAFACCETLSEISIPASVETLGTNVFDSCTGLLSVTVPEDIAVTAIPDYAFNGCTSLASVTLPQNLISIGESAFDGCPLTSIEIPSKVEEIENRAFANTLIFSIVLPSTLTEKNIEIYTQIGMNAFPTAALAHTTLHVLKPDYEISTLQPWGTGNTYPTIENITCADGASWIAVLNGENKDCFGFTYAVIDDECTLTNYTGSATELSVPEKVIFSGETEPRTVTAIGDEAFKNKKLITQVKLPDSIISIGIYAFNSCEKLQTIDLPESLSSINHFAFLNCLALNNVTLPSTLTSMGGNVFEGCTNLSEITLPSNIVTLPNGTFSGCTALTEISLPNTLTTIGASAFYGCTALNNVDLSKITTIKDGAFYRCIVLNNIDLSKVITIGNTAFSFCTALESVDLSKATKISLSAFFSCTKLRNVTLSEIKEIGSSAFQGCVILESINLCEATTIGANAFDSCSLTNVVIPSSVTTMGENAFIGNSDDINNSVTLHVLTKNFGLTSMQPWGKGDSYPTLTEERITCAEGASWYPKLTKVDGELTGTDMYGFKYKKNDDGDDECTLITYTGSAAELVIPAKVIFSGETEPRTVTAIAGGAFKSIYSITQVTLPDSITSIGEEAFYDCRQLQEINLPDGLSSINQYAFTNCVALNNVTLPSNLTSMGKSVFASCTALSNITLSSNMVTLPDGTFHSCTALTEISLPNTLTTIDKYAFEGCTALKNVVIPSSVTTIGTDAFKGVTDVQDNGVTIRVVAPNTWVSPAQWSGITVTDLIVDETVADASYKLVLDNNKNDVFGLQYDIDGTNAAVKDYGGNRTDIVIPDYVYTAANDDSRCTVTEIIDSAFRVKSNIQSVTLPSNLESIGNYAFCGCSELEIPTFPEGLLTIGEYAFCYCKNTETVSLPSTLTSIGDSAFENVTINNIVIPSQLITEPIMTIGNNAFPNADGAAVTLTVNDAAFELKTLKPFGNKLPPITKVTVKDGVSWKYQLDADGYMTDTGCKFKFEKKGLNECALTGVEVTGTADVIVPTYVLFADGTLCTVTNVANSGNVSGMNFRVVLPDTVTSIGALFKASGLSGIVIPSTITAGSINEKAFENCGNLTGLTMRVTTNDYELTSLHPWYKEFPPITSIMYSEGVTWNQTLQKTDAEKFRDYYFIYKLITDTNEATEVTVYSVGNTSTNSVIPEYVVLPPDANGVSKIASVVKIDVSAFKGRLAETVKLPESIVEIGEGAFYDCPILASIELPDSLTTIGATAFMNCQKLKNVVIPSSVTTIGADAFKNVPDVTDNGVTIRVVKTDTIVEPYQWGITAPEITNVIYSDDVPNKVINVGVRDQDGYRYDVYGLQYVKDNGKWCIYDYTGNSSILDIPDEIFINSDPSNRADVKGIVSNAFAGKTELDEINLPSNLEYLGDGVFNGCTGIKDSVYIPDSVTRIDGNPFTSCTSIIEFELGSQNQYFVSDNGAIYDNSGVLRIYPNGKSGGELVLPESSTGIGKNAINTCNQLTSITLSDATTTLSSTAFNGLTNLTEISFPNNNITVVNDGDGQPFESSSSNVEVIYRVINNGILKNLTQYGATITKVEIADGVDFKALKTVDISKLTDVVCDDDTYKYFSHDYDSGYCQRCGLECPHEHITGDHCDDCLLPKDTVTSMTAHPIEYGTAITNAVSVTFADDDVKATAEYKYYIHGSDTPLTEAPTLPGDYDVELITHNSTYMGKKIRLQFNILERAVITTATLPNGIVGESYSQEIKSQSTAPNSSREITFSVTEGSLPTGLSLNAATGVISGTPKTDGVYSFTIKAAIDLEATADYEITISKKPQITTTTLPNAKKGTAYNQTITATGTAPITFTVSDGSLPTGLSLDETTGVISGTTTAIGTFSFTIKATNTSGSDEKSYSVTISANGGSGGSGGSGGGGRIPTDNDENEPICGNEEGWESITALVEKTSEGKTLLIDMNSTTIVSSDFLAKLKGKNIIAVLTLDGYIWTINGKDIANAQNADLEIKMTADTVTDSLISSIIGKVQKITVCGKSDFGFTAVLELNLGTAEASKIANLYTYDKKTGKLVIVSAVKADEQGNVQLKLGGGFTGVIASDSVSQLLGDVINDCTVNTRDALLILKYAVGSAQIDENLLPYADVNNDGTINIKYALAAMKASLA